MVLKMMILFIFWMAVVFGILYITYKYLERKDQMEMERFKARMKRDEKALEIAEEEYASRER